MSFSLLYITFLLLGSIILMIIATGRWKLNAFFVLLAMSLLIGGLMNMQGDKLIATLKHGFGVTMEKIGLLIILGTTLGIILEKTGATISLANAILKKVGQKNAPMAMSVAGFIVGLPIFCDSGFIILNGLNLSLTKRTGASLLLMTTALATGLYSVHCLVPPHPGISAAVGTMGADMGMVMLLGVVVAIPATIMAFFWIKKQSSKFDFSLQNTDNQPIEEEKKLPNPLLAIVPILLPIAMIAFKSIYLLYQNTPEAKQKAFSQWVSFFCEPITALLVAIVISLFLLKDFLPKNELNTWLSESIEKAAPILVIVGGGGMFGGILQQTGIGEQLGKSLATWNLGIWLPFLLAVLLKTAQGSSTVAVMTTAALLAPMIPALGWTNNQDLTLAVLAMGAGSMCLSHANDAYFWVIARFATLPTPPMFSVYSTASVIMALVAQLSIWIISFLI